MIRIRTFKIKNYPYKKSRQLAETLARREFARRNYTLFRGFFLGAENFGQYPRTKEKYAFLEALFIRKIGYAKYHWFRTYCEENRGEPDFIIYDQQSDLLLFIEIKFKYESIKKHQLRCMKEIVKTLNLPVEVWRFVDSSIRVREEIIELPEEIPKRITSHKRVVKKDVKLTKFI